MQMPRPTKHHQKLEAFAGNWTGEETMFPGQWSPETRKAKGTMKSRMDLDGFCLIQDYAQRCGGKIAFRGHGVFSYDPQQKCYLWHWSDSMGGMAPELTRGEWKGSKLVFQNASPMGHGRYTYTFHRDGSLGFTMESSPDGTTWTKAMEGRYTRKG